MGELRYKSDWGDARQRYVAWWKGERLDRCLVSVVAPLDDAPDEAPPTPPDDPAARWTDLAYRSALNDYGHGQGFFGAEAFPIWNPGYPGHVSLATFYGSPLRLDRDTGWHEPILTGERLDVSGLAIDRDNPWWVFGLELAEHARTASLGKSLPAMCAIGGVGDTLAALRGTERYLLDMLDDPVAVREAELALVDDWFEVYRVHSQILRNGDDWHAGWFPLWAPGTFYPLQCDVSYGISPDTFRECFVPALTKWAQGLDYTIHHLDGVGAFHLVEEVCRIEAIDAVQVLPGEGKPSPLHYLDTLRAVQRMGKRLHITIPSAEVRDALEVLSARGLCLEVTGVACESEARKVIEKAARCSVDRG